MDDRRRRDVLARLEEAAKCRQTLLQSQKDAEASRIEALDRLEDEIFARRSQTIAGLSLELELSSARLNRIAAERELARRRQLELAEDWASMKRLGMALARRREILAAKVERAAEERRILDWVETVHLRQDASSRTDS